MKPFLLLLLPFALFAKFTIVVSYPYIEVLTKEIAGDNLNVSSLSKGDWDPHFVVPKPSLIAKIRSADGIIINGAQLEIGWLPSLIERSGNSLVTTGSDNFLNLSNYINHIHVPHEVSRSGGDVHPDGNPHMHLDPKNILVLANAIARYLIRIDSENMLSYEKNYKNFIEKFEKKLKIWNAKMQDKKGIKVIQYHDVLAYFGNAYGIKTVGTIEPLPGISPSSKHIFSLIKRMKDEKVSYILHDVYHPTKKAEYISSKTNVPLVIAPHDVRALESIEDLYALFDYLTDMFQ